MQSRLSIAKSDLSRRQREVLDNIAAGRTCAQIAEGMGVSIHTVRNHVRRIYKKLHVRKSAQAVAMRGKVSLKMPRSEKAFFPAHRLRKGSNCQDFGVRAGTTVLRDFRVNGFFCFVAVVTCLAPIAR